MSQADPGAGSPTVAIVGSGPSGCYTAQFLRKHWRDSEIVVFDRLDLPYGLVRYGVAPDHQGTKAVAKQFDRLFERDGVRFVGRTEVGTDVTLEALREAFDVVVLATGLSADRPLDGAADGLAGVYGAGTLTRLVNGHPDELVDGIELGSVVTIVGQGNVALDLVRLFLTPAADLLALGVAPEVVETLGRGPIERIEIVGRSAAPMAKFDVAMAKELSRLPDVAFLADGLELDPEDGAGAGDEARRSAIADLVAGSPEDASRTVHFRFGWSPDHVTGTDSVDGIVFRSADGRELAVRTDSVCTAIGFAEAETAPVQRTAHEGPGADIGRGILDDGLFVVGWLRRGPQGTIPANRADSKMVAETIATAVAGGDLPIGKPGFAAIAPALETPAEALPTLI
ncbi:FAD-dependent oxidoreductase [Frondihabitans cladoniiphilus]|uniref:ferredoxin--NADP(+) reductase n=1 Tax=Frondihabitans cladoniiphilus TaxID=715785 RepID=A0ABP8VK46_9MICO